MRNLIKIAAIAGALLGCGTIAQAQSFAQGRQQASTEAGVGNAHSHGAFAGFYGSRFGSRGPYAQYYGGGFRHHRHHRW
jgi:hypothetical protein